MDQINILTGLLHGDENIHVTAKSVIPQLSDACSWIIKYSQKDIPANLQAIGENKHVRVVGQTDSSLYAGLNQALAEIDSGYFLVLGAGDTLEPDAISRIAATANANPNLDSLYFAVRVVRSGSLLLPRPAELGVRMACPHPGALLKTANAKLMGGFDERYAIAADYDLLSRYVLKHPHCGWMDNSVLNYAGGGLSERRALEGYLEEELVRLRVWHSPQQTVCTRAIKFLQWAEAQLSGVQ